VNMVCLGDEGSASAVLLRAGAIIAGEDLARARRTRGPVPEAPVPGGRVPGGRVPGGRVPGGPVPEGRAWIASRDLARGPARLCQALAIDRSLDGADVCVAGSPLRVRAGAGNPARSATIVTGPRVGVSSAAEIPWRFWYEGDPTVSVYRPHAPRRPKPVTP
jgi:DNA-3-methyladenine glycosylase